MGFGAFLKSMIAESPSRTGDTNHLNISSQKLSPESGSGGDNNSDSCSVMFDRLRNRLVPATEASTSEAISTSGCTATVSLISQLTGFAAPDVGEQRLFCESYLQEMRDLGEDVSSEIETVDHLLLEASNWAIVPFASQRLRCVRSTMKSRWILCFLSSLVHVMKTYEQAEIGFRAKSSGNERISRIVLWSKRSYEEQKRLEKGEKV
jgi:hypothetical protein